MLKKLIISRRNNLVELKVHALISDACTYGDDLSGVVNYIESELKKMKSGNHMHPSLQYKVFHNYELKEVQIKHMTNKPRLIAVIRYEKS
jgi:hypothetical protein